MLRVTYVVDHVYVSTDNYYEDYSKFYAYDETHLFVCTRECFDPLPDDIKNCYTEQGMVENYCLFVSNENPWLDE